MEDHTNWAPACVLDAAAPRVPCLSPHILRQSRRVVRPSSRRRVFDL